ncbi:hypothetical protein MRX96_013704 [Rhipicephalus microplus]
MSANNSNTSVSKEDAYRRQQAMEQLSVLDQEGTRAPTNSAISVEARTPELPTALGPTLRCRVDSKTAFAKRRSQPTVAEVDHKATDDSFSDVASNE